MDQGERDGIIVRTGLIGIGTNLVLSAFKTVIGLISGSIAVVLDAVNNLSDALSSIITIIGVKLAAKPADKEHPLGYGRVEYLSAMIIAGIVLAAGFTSLIESAKKLITPSEVSYTVLSLIVIAVAVAAKIVLGLYTKRKGKETDSDSLIASGSDAMFDSIISFSTLLSAVISIIWGLNLDGLFGLVISAVIIKAGIGMLKDTLDDILGKRADAALVHSLKQDIAAVPDVLGVYDLLLDSYGPSKLAGSVHIEVEDDMQASDIDELSRKITLLILRKYSIYLTVGIYAVPSLESSWHEKYQQLRNILSSQEGVLQIHGFHVDEERKIVFFDVVRSFDITDVKSWLEGLRKLAGSIIPGYAIHITADTDFSDE